MLQNQVWILKVDSRNRNRNLKNARKEDQSTWFKNSMNLAFMNHDVTLLNFERFKTCKTVITYSAKNKVGPMDNGHPERAFFQKFESFGLGQTNWAGILGCILVISSQTIGTILTL